MDEVTLVRTVAGRELPEEVCREVPATLAYGGRLDDLPGIGTVTARKLEAAMEFSRVVDTRRAQGRIRKIGRPEDAFDLMLPIYRGETREHFHVLMLNTKNRLLCDPYEVSVGSLNASLVHPRELFKAAIRISAAAVVITHNHPSGDPTPSGADIQLTRRIVKAGDVLGIDVLDHVVIGDTPASLRDLGLM
jgi:DNA repair protein RadC